MPTPNFRPVDDDQLFEANLKDIGHYLDSLSVVYKPISITPDFKRQAEDFLIHDERLFHGTRYGIQFVLPIEMLESTLKALHDEVGYWEFNSAYSCFKDRFW